MKNVVGALEYERDMGAAICAMVNPALYKRLNALQYDNSSTVFDSVPPKKY